MTTVEAINVTGNQIIRGGEDSYLYDSIGNLQKKTTSAGETDFTINTLNQYVQLTGASAATPQYDLNGNMTSDGQGHTYIYDEENRLTEVDNTTAVDNILKTVSAYDGLSRRIEKRTYGSDNTLLSTARYFYDELLPIAEYNAENSLIQTYTRGLDLSDTMQGAGGVGGLLALTNTNGKVYSYFCDGSGNVVDLIDASGAGSSHYQYDSFGHVIAQSGARLQPYQWASKETDQTSNLICFHYRLYSDDLGRWINRDPDEENGGVNIYEFALNNTPNVTDLFGLGNYVIGRAKEPPMTFDEDYKYDPKAKPTVSDHLSWLDWGNLLKLSQKFRPDMLDANEAYAHYRSGTGTDLKINYQKAYNDDLNIREALDGEIASAKTAAESLSASGGASFEMTGDAVRFVDNPTTENWQKTIGQHWIWGSASVKADCDGSGVTKYTMTLILHEKDRYNFNRGSADIATGFHDSVNGRFAVLGWAKSFFTNGSLVKTLIWVK